MSRTNLRLPTADDPELMALVDRYLMPDQRYVKLLHANFMRLGGDERRAFIQSLRADASSIDDATLSILLSSEWRCRLTASYLIAASKRESFVDQLGDLLIRSELTYAGQGFCVALASIGTAAAAIHLSAYLDRWLPDVECRYDQDWAMAALMSLDELAGSTYAHRFLVAEGLWDAWARDPRDLARRVQLVDGILTSITI